MARPTDTRSTRQSALLLVAALVPLLVFAVITTVASLRSQRVAQERDALAQARRISTLVDEELQRELDVAKTLAAQPLLDSPANLAAFGEMLRRIQAAHPLWLTAILADPDGKVLLATRHARERVVDPADFHQVVEQRQALVGTIARGVDLALPVRAPVIRDGQVRYVVVLAIRPEAVRDRVLATEVPASWTAAVTDKTGRLVVRTRGPESMLAQLASPVALEARAHATSGVFQGRLREGVPDISAFYVSPATGWTVFVAIPSALFNAPIDRAVRLAVGGGTISIGLAALFVVLLLREQRRRRQEAAASQDTQRLEALGRLTGGVAHDFNNLLAVVSGNLELLERRLPGAAGHRSVAAIRGAVERGVSLTRSLLTFSRSGFGQGTVEDVNACVRDVFGMMRQTVGAGVAAELDLNEPLPPVLVDRVQFDLALLNLAANARDAMPRGGTLRVATRAVALADGRPGVVVMVADTGVGIASSILPRVFEPFFTTKEVGRGTGLGLAQVYGFARNAGGEARVESRVGTGTTVSILLPFASAASGQAANGPERPPAQMTGGGAAAPCRILLVDDNAPVRELTASVLREDFAQVDEAEDPTAALVLLETGAYAAVVSDIVMPGAMDGIGLAREIRRRWPATAVLLMSGYADSAGQARSLGVPVLTKPLELARLAETVREAVERLRAMAEAGAG